MVCQIVWSLLVVLVLFRKTTVQTETTIRLVMNVTDIKYLQEESAEIQRRGRSLNQVRKQHKENLLSALDKADKKNGEAGIIASLLRKLNG